MLLGKKLNVLLVLIPLAVIGDAKGWSPGFTFAVALAALCPLAERINFLTEQCSGWSSEVIAAILHVSFGNATELIVSVFALKAGLLRVLQLSLLGALLVRDRLALTCLPFSTFFFNYVFISSDPLCLRRPLASICR
jgi:Ca2+:H+ antiporter